MSLQGTLNFGHGSDDPLYFGQNRFLTPIQIDIKIKMNSLIQIFFYYNISFFNVNRKIKFHSDFTLFCIIIHYLKRYSIIAAVTLSLSFIDIMFDIITFLSSPDVNNL